MFRRTTLAAVLLSLGVVACGPQSPGADKANQAKTQAGEAVQKAGEAAQAAGRDPDGNKLCALYRPPKGA